MARILKYGFVVSNGRIQMFSNDWKFLLMAPLAVTLLSACQSKNSDEPKASPSSPYQGLWLSTNTDYELEQCRYRGGRMQVHDVDAIFIQGDGQVLRYIDKETFAKPDARAAMRVGQVQNNGQFSQQGSYGAYESSMRDGMSVTLNDTHMELRRADSQVVKNYVRTTDTQLQKKRMELMGCLGYGQNFSPDYYGHHYGDGGPQPHYSQMQPRDGMPRNYPAAEPRMATPGPQANGQRLAVPVPQGAPLPQPVPPQVQAQPPQQVQPVGPQMQQPDGNYPAPPEMYQPDRRNQPWLQEPMPQQ